MRRHLGRLNFLWSAKGKVDKDVVLFMVMEFQRYMKLNSIQGPAVLWITPPLFESYSLLAWTTARKSGILIEKFPQHLYDSYRLTNRGAFEKLVANLDKEITKRYLIKSKIIIIF